MKKKFAKLCLHFKTTEGKTPFILTRFFSENWKIKNLCLCHILAPSSGNFRLKWNQNWLFLFSTNFWVGIGCAIFHQIVALNDSFYYRNRMRRAQIWAAKTRIIRQVKNETPKPSRRRSNLPPKNWRLARIKLHQRSPQSLRSHPKLRTPTPLLSLPLLQPIPLLKLQSEFALRK